jgi:hypothetical protein
MVVLLPKPVFQRFFCKIYVLQRQRGEEMHMPPAAARDEVWIANGGKKKCVVAPAS